MGSIVYVVTAQKERQTNKVSFRRALLLKMQLNISSDAMRDITCKGSFREFAKLSTGAFYHYTYS